jgi:outer membrane protein assembly factor BamE (lipoprotein component of BamABCDE complex)
MKMINYFFSNERYLSNWNLAKILTLLTGLLFFASSCISLGKVFPVSHVPAIKIGKTTKSEVRRLFGSPWLSGKQDGELAWTYGNYDYSVFGERKAKDLVIQFDDNGVVKTYTFSTTEHKE